MKLILDDTCEVCGAQIKDGDKAMLVARGKATKVGKSAEFRGPDAVDELLPEGKLRVVCAGRPGAGDGFRAALCEYCANAVALMLCLGTELGDVVAKLYDLTPEQKEIH